MKLVFFIIVILGISSISPAPTSRKTVASLIRSDKRVGKLSEKKFVSGFCRDDETSSSTFADSLCFSLYDVALSLNLNHIEFSNQKVEVNNEEFCKKLEEKLPEKPLNAEVANEEITWFKDMLNSPEGLQQCQSECIYEEKTDYELRVTPVCQFLFDQLMFIQQRSDASKKQQEINTTPTKKVDKTNNASSTVGKIEGNLPTTVVKKEEIGVVPAAAIASPTSKNVVPQEISLTADTLNDTAVSNQMKPTPIGSGKVTKIEEKSEVKTVEETAVNEPALGKDDTTKKGDGEVEDLDLQNNENMEDDSVDKDVFGSNVQNVNPSDDPASDKDPDEDDDEDFGANQMPIKQSQDNSIDTPEATNDKLQSVKVFDPDFKEASESNFFAYLCGVMFLCVFLYVLHQNRQKVLALCLEGRRGSRRNRERSRGGSKAAYSKLDCNLEEAIMSKKSLNGKSMDIIY